MGGGSSIVTGLSTRGGCLGYCETQVRTRMKADHGEAAQAGNSSRNEGSVREEAKYFE